MANLLGGASRDRDRNFNRVAGISRNSTPPGSVQTPRSIEMSVYASHRGIPYKLDEQRPGEWAWSFQPPDGPGRRGIVRGEYQFALTVVRRGIEVWFLMNTPHNPKAA